MTTQGRKPPAYMEYPASEMAALPYRTSSLAERGLAITLKYELWENERLPADPATLARLIGFPENEIRQLLPAVMYLFAVQDGFILSPALELYRAYLKDIRKKQSAGGTRGAMLTNSVRAAANPYTSQRDSSESANDSTSNSTSNSTVNPRVSRGSTRESSVQPSPTHNSKTQSLSRDVADLDDWAKDYGNAEQKECSAEDYRTRRGT